MASVPASLSRGFRHGAQKILTVSRTEFRQEKLTAIDAAKTELIAFVQSATTDTDAQHRAVSLLERILDSGASRSRAAEVEERQHRLEALEADTQRRAEDVRGSACCGHRFRGGAGLCECVDRPATPFPASQEGGHRAQP